MIKNDEIYPLYLAYLERKCLSKGAFSLSKISEQLFSDFKEKYMTLPGFKDKQDKLYLNISRDIKIDNILDDFDSFMNDL